MRYALLLVVCAAVLASCGADTPTAVSGLSGVYSLRTADGQVVPFSDASFCGAPCALASGSLSILANDTILVRETTTSPPSSGVPGISSTAIGHYILHRVGDRFAMEPGPDITLGRAVDTLTVTGDTIVVRSTSPTSRFHLRTYTH